MARHNPMEADPVEVKKILDHLLEAFEDYYNNAEEPVDYIDAFMAVHNFHMVVVLDMERRVKMDTRQQLFLRKMAVDTFKHAMETKAAFKQEEIG